MFGNNSTDFYVVRVVNEFGEVVYYGTTACFTSCFDKAIKYSNFDDAYSIQNQLQNLHYVLQCTICHYKEF